MSEQTSHINNKRTTEAKWGVEDSRLTFDQSWLVHPWVQHYLNTCWFLTVQHSCHSSHCAASSPCSLASSKLSVKLRLLVMAKKIPNVLLFLRQTGCSLFPNVWALVNMLKCRAVLATPAVAPKQVSADGNLFVHSELLHVQTGETASATCTFVDTFSMLGAHKKPPKQQPFRERPRFTLLLPFYFFHTICAWNSNMIRCQMLDNHFCSRVVKRHTTQKIIQCYYLKRIAIQSVLVL